MATGSAAEWPRFLHADFAAAVRTALPSNPILGPLAAAAQGQDPSAAQPSRSAFVCRNGLLYLRSRRDDRLCVPAAGALRAQKLHLLHITPCGGGGVRAHLPDVSARQGRPDHLPPAGLLYPLQVRTRRGGCIGLDFLELPVARSSHDILQLHIDPLTGSVWLVLTPDLPDRHCRDGSSQLHRVGVSRRGAAWRARL